MSGRDTHSLGYNHVDDDPNVSVLIATMDATARWDATSELRRWERDHLHLAEGDRLLDVGCGLGDAAVTLGADLGSAGEVVGIDASAAMLTVARERSTSAICQTRFAVGDALALDEADRSFDAVRSERTLQWLTDPPAAIDELVRVLRPRGRISLIDTDWSTLRLDVGDDAVSMKVREAMRVERRRPSNVGSRLHELVRAAGFQEIQRAAATQVWMRWDPDESPAPDGCFSMHSLANDLVTAGQLDQHDVNRFVTTIHHAARSGHFSMSLTMFAVIGVGPGTPPSLDHREGSARPGLAAGAF